MAMTDSIRTIEDDYLRRIHSNRGSGRLHKGHSITAATASIPGKYQTIVTDNSELKGFLSRSKRFNYEGSVGENPGPGSYVRHNKVTKDSPSFSKKGTGGFASKDRRISKHESTCSPGSGAYKLPGFIDTQADYNKAGTTSVFHKPIAQNKDESRKKNLPAPNQYDITKANFGKANNVTANAAFKSKSKRDSVEVGSDVRTKPAPWQYHVNENLVKNNPQVPFSSFKSKTERKMAADPAPVPGPGTYKPHENVDHPKKLLFPRKHYLCISAPAMPLPDLPPQPGPGQYDVVDYEGPAKHFMSNAVFVSSTSRWTGHARTTDLPGPAHYRPAESNKQSFIYNAQGRWI